MGVEEANKRIYATTDRAKGTQKQLAEAQGGHLRCGPCDDVGYALLMLSAVGQLPSPLPARHRRADAGRCRRHGRFSVLSPTTTPQDMLPSATS